MTKTTEVEARFADDGRIIVTNFAWQGRKQAVTGHGRQWDAADGRHLLVMTVGDRVFELVYDRVSGRWEVAKAPKARGAA